MKIIHIASEFAPFAKAGGLGEVITGLSKELARTGKDIHVILPKYSFLKLDNLHQELQFTVPMWDLTLSNTMWSTKVGLVHLHLLETSHPHNLFNRETIYGFADDVPRFLYFSKAVAEYLKLKLTPDTIVHLHDWHTAAVATLLREQNIHPQKILLSIHNLEYQGKCGLQDLQHIGIQNTKKFQDSSHPDSYNTLKGGLEDVDAIVAVSPTYSKEILTPAFGFNLDKDLLRNKRKLSGILNGIDYETWNPEADQYLETHYSPADPPDKIKACKKSLQAILAHRFNLEGGPWIGAITRIVPQKGPELIEATLEYTVRSGGVFTLLGSSPIPKMQHHFEALKRKYHSHRQVLIELTFDEELAHELYAALDFTIIPSHFEPCGLTQMTSMHYGTIPIVHSTGGLKDTVSEKNGFPFTKLTTPCLHKALDKAFTQWTRNPTAHQKMILQGMQSDFSWEKPAQEYLRLYTNETIA